jgi:hypothetical protein
MSTTRMGEFYDIYGLWHLPWWQHFAFKVIGFVIISILVAFFIVFLLRKVMKRKKQLSPWEIADRDLADLGAPEMFTQASAKQFYSRLTFTIKQYLCFRYGFDIIGKTDHEILALLEAQIVFSRDLLPLLSEVFEHASQIKFANTAGIVEQMRSDLVLCKRLIKETMPVQS